MLTVVKGPFVTVHVHSLSDIAFFFDKHVCESGDFGELVLLKCVWLCLSFPISTLSIA